MPRNGSGSYSLPSGNPVVTGTAISSTVQNNTMSDIATALTASIAKDGQTTPTANLPMGGFKHTGAANGSAATDYATISNLQNGTGIHVSTVGGTSDVITLTPSPAIASYAAGQYFSFVSSGANTTNVTVNVSGLGAKAITKNGATALVAGDVPSGALVAIIYDGTQFQLQTSANLNPLSSITGLGSNVSTFLATPSSANLRGALTDETGTGAAVFADTPTLVTPILGTPTSGTLTNCSGYPTVTLRTPVASTSGTEVDFNSIPSGVKRIDITFSGVSTNGTSNVIVQIGDSGGIENTGYLSTIGLVVGGTAGAVTTGFGFASPAAASVMHGVISLVMVDSSTNTWASASNISFDAGQFNVGAGSKSLSATLDRVRITMANGTDTFDAGKINIQYVS